MPFGLGLGLGLGVSGDGLRLGLEEGSSATTICFGRGAGLGLKPGSILGLRVGSSIAGILCVGAWVVV